MAPLMSMETFKFISANNLGNACKGGIHDDSIVRQQPFKSSLDFGVL